ncbi:hypothetical protein QFZ37_003810 [Chryseobacterium ginsenosidimutans]|uniref:hypothetical protein n=1 Tax=Chryseobacterium ginsenosidimutans TaxID=687846 RepID=UPI0027837C36|nr:hypothetical protein [Chryseobacterium ginsenosidimutans]MDQ0595441.1 hypothetical protein [Chryseobacterium ginsenosidimutans]
MKKILRVIAIAILSIFTITACKHQAKDEEVNLKNVAELQKTDPDEITKDIYTDEYGDQLEVTVNETQNTAVVRLDGKSYDLKKKEDLPEYTAGDSEYQFSDIRGEVTFLKKDYNMVLFHHKKNKISSPNTKMASY